MQSPQPSPAPTPSRAADDQSLQQAMEAVREIERRAVVGQFALELMHELRNPLEALSHLTWLTRAESDDAEKVRYYTDLAEEQLHIVRELTNQTLGYGRSSPTPQTGNLAKVALAALRIHQKTIAAKQINLFHRAPDELALPMHGGEILQVLSNLIVNALDALPVGGSLHVRLRRHTDHACVVVADNGSGISAEHRSRVFDPFFTTKGSGGNGIGLALSHRIVERHRGRIDLRSSTRAGHSGTTFRVTLPC